MGFLARAFLGPPTNSKAVAVVEFGVGIMGVVDDVMIITEFS